MTVFLLTHTHTEGECAAAFAAWADSESPLRGESAWAGCAHGEHRVYWRVEANDADAALAMLPGYVAARTVVTPVRPVVTP
jgi:hypothetical protein